MKILITYYSRTGNTRKVAEDLAKLTKADIDEIIDLTDRSGIKGWILGGRDAFTGSLTEIKINKDPSDYDLVVIGTPVWAGSSTPAVRTYLTQYKNKIKKLAVFNTSGGDGIEKTIEVIKKISGIEPFASEGWKTTDIKRKDVYENKLKNITAKIT